jgi:membrane-associated PAP2 superfamily phosphatase
MPRGWHGGGPDRRREAVSRLGPRRRVDLAVTIGALVALVAWELSGLDLALARVLGSAGGFPLRDDFLVRSVLHDGGRWLSGLLLAALALDAWRPFLRGPQRSARAYWLAVVALAMAAVPLAKRFSATSCPWDLAEFGGHVAYVPHWLLAIADGGPGHCFPSGHAVAAFAFFGTWFLWRDHRPRLGRALVAGVLLLGAAFAWAQMARGAHFASHALWSAWLCWTIAAAAQFAAPRAQDARNAPRTIDAASLEAAPVLTSDFSRPLPPPSGS